MAQGLSRLDTLRTLRVANIDVAFASAFGAIVGGTFLIGFVRFLGGSDMWVQAMIALPSLAGLFQIPGAIWGRAHPSYQRFIAPGGWIWRLLYAPLIVLPLLVWPGEVKLWILAGCVLLASIAVQWVSSTYNDWIAEIVPSSSRGWYLSRRTAIATAAAMAVAFVGAVMLDAFRRNGQEAVGFSILFALGFVCAIASMVFFLKMKDTPRSNPVRLEPREAVRQFWRPFKDRAFHPILAFTGVFMVGATLAGGLYAAFALETLKLDYTALQLTAVAHAVGTVLFARLWGFLADRYGNKPVLAILMAGTMVTPVIWLFCVPGQTLANILILTIGHVYNGAVWSGVDVVRMNLYINTANEEDRANYLGTAFAVQSVVGAAAPLAGAALMVAMRSSMPAEAAYKTLFVAVMGVRLVSLLLVLPIREAGSAPISTAIGQLRRLTPKGIRAFRRLSSTDDATARAEAIGLVGDASFTLASGELLKALADPSPRVRRQAAVSLGKINDPSVESALIRFVAEQPDLVEEETLEALGDLQASTAVPVVARFMEDPRAYLRRQAAKTLGRIGSHEAVAPLCRAAHDAGDPDLRRAAIQALRLLGSPEASTIVAEALTDQHSSVRTAAAEAAAELGDTALAPAVRESLAAHGLANSSEQAYALGALGNPDDFGLILDCADAATNRTGRRRCLLGAARLFGVERQLYLLFTMDGFTRDSELIRALRPAYAKSGRLRAATEAFSAGQEKEAVSKLLANSPGPLQAAKGRETPDLFLLCSLVVAARWSGTLAVERSDP
ncbi:MAG: MFS transporter [Fimbriimonadaceae bacterium]|nr:MFS transporter [Fimbriimonadaceae bacterium]QYK57702.1 MAG: MFS transporter [Fimbriimonadaceae bacterium]